MGATRRDRATVAMAVGALLCGAALAGPASAQQAMTVPEIRACTCEEQAMATLRQRNDAARAAYDERWQREQNLSRQISQLQATMDPHDLSAQDQLRELIDLRARVAQGRRDALPAWQAATTRLNAVVSDYNSKCVGRPMFKMDVEAANQNLVCPVTP